MKLKLFHKCTQQCAAFILESRAESHSTSEGAITGPQKCQLSCSCQGRWPDVDVLPHVGLLSASLTTASDYCDSNTVCAHTNIRASTKELKHSMWCCPTEITSPLYALCLVLPSSYHAQYNIRNDCFLKPFQNSNCSTCWGCSESDNLQSLTGFQNQKPYKEWIKEYVYL